MENAVQLKFPGLTLMQCGEPEEEGTYLCLIKGRRGFFWEKQRWVEALPGLFLWRSRLIDNVIAWQPIPPIPTEQELEQLYKAPISNDE